MKKYIIRSLLLIGVILSFANIAEAGYTKGYYKPSTGRYVQSYYRSSPNSFKFDNYSSRGNYNPYTGRKGYTSYYSW